jgi:hypothetical protein
VLVGCLGTKEAEISSEAIATIQFLDDGGWVQVMAVEGMRTNQILDKVKRIF